MIKKTKGQGKVSNQKEGRKKGSVDRRKRQRKNAL